MPRRALRFSTVLASLIGISTLVVACAEDLSVGRATATLPSSEEPEATTEPTLTPSPSPSPTASPTPEAERLAPDIAEFSQAGGALNVRIHNPNENVGLIRASFELTALAADGSIITVLGSQGLPGAPFSTIYRLPPGGDFGIQQPLDPSGAAIAQLELVVTDDWVEWDSVEPPEAVLSNVSLVGQDFGGPKLTGRVAVAEAAEEGPFNVWIQAFVTSPAGLIVIAEGVDCVSTADPRAFELMSFAFDVAGPFTLENVVAYTTTVPGVTEPAPDLC